jgi:O-acetyl-ADP-ribose deacetylase (regulator of RNase III)
MTDTIITIVSLNEEYVKIASKNKNFNVQKIKIQNYTPIRKNVFYVSPANSLGFMDSGIDFALSRIVMPGIEQVLKKEIQKYGKKTLLNRDYLPIGSSIVVEHKVKNMTNSDTHYYCVSAPTMWMPQNISNTQNCYHATRSSLYNILINCKYQNVEIIFTSMGCGWGKMTSQQSFDQFLKAVNDYDSYNPYCVDKCVIDEPNKEEQPLFYQNTEWKTITPENVILY